MSHTNLRIVMVAALGLAATSFLSAATAEERAVAGRFTVEYSSQHALEIPDAKGHVILLGQAEGANEAVTGTYMDGARVTNREFTDIVRGNGMHRGYTTMTDGESRTVTEWSGEVETRMEGDRPATSFAGEWRKINGTGEYRDITGSGTYEGQFVAEDAYVVEWRGVIQTP